MSPSRASDAPTPTRCISHAGVRTGTRRGCYCASSNSSQVIAESSLFVTDVLARSFTRPLLVHELTSKPPPFVLNGEQKPSLKPGSPTQLAHFEQKSPSVAVVPLPLAAGAGGFVKLVQVLLQLE
jgi:hypothetical protein